MSSVGHSGIEKLLYNTSIRQLEAISQDQWIQKDLFSSCSLCDHKFHTLRRRYQCRSCGNVVCRHCQQKCHVQVQVDVVLVRLCLHCMDETLQVKPNERKGSSTRCSSSHSSLLHDHPNKGTVDEYSLVGSSHNEDGKDQVLKSFLDDQEKCSNLISNVNEDCLLYAPEDEVLRQELIDGYQNRMSSWNTELNALCELASRALNCPVAAVAFMGVEFQLYHAKLGISQCQLPRSVSFCAQLTRVESLEPIIVMDTTIDDRFCHNPLVKGSAHIRFYASYPIYDPTTKIVLGSVFVMDNCIKNKVPERAHEILIFISNTVEQLLHHSLF